MSAGDGITWEAKKTEIDGQFSLCATGAGVTDEHVFTVVVTPGYDSMWGDRIAALLTMATGWRTEDLQRLAKKGDISDMLRFAAASHAMLKSIVSDVDAMRSGDPHYFKGFDTYSTGLDGRTMEVEWPNLSTLVEEASAHIKGDS